MIELVFLISLLALLALCALLLILPATISIAIVLAFLGHLETNVWISAGLYLLAAWSLGIYLMRFRK